MYRDDELLHMMRIQCKLLDQIRMALERSEKREQKYFPISKKDIEVYELYKEDREVDDV